MIRRIGVVCQDRNSYGFLLGLQRRLKCDALLVEPETVALGKSTTMTRTQAKLAARDLEKKGVDLIVRFTDSDVHRWQDVKRHEIEAFPEDSRSIVICAVAVQNVEQWLALDASYIEAALGLQQLSAITAQDRTGVLKSAIARSRKPDEPVSEVTARIVADAPTEVFRGWLNGDQSLRRFYQECRAAATQVNCPVPNELGDGSD